LNQFGKENIEDLKDFRRRIELSCENGFDLYVKEIYCNMKFPENRTIKITSMSGIFCKIFKNNDWSLECFDKIIFKLLKNYYNFMKETEDDEFMEYFLTVFQIIVKKDKNEIKKFKTYSKRNILPMLYNATKCDKEINFLQQNKNKKKLIKRKN